ncbi:MULTISPECIES: hypothetical protein [unclassified Streptomyces]|uniref:CIS tube protein n=1 Tax=unclassified Streptomyces TaxID=2593676 RepID=UPI00345101D3
MTLPVSGSLQRNVTKALLRSEEQPDKIFTFEYNPTEISLSHNAEGLSDPMGGEKTGNTQFIVSSITTRGSTRLIMSPLTFTGDRIQDIAMLLDWVTEHTQKRADGTVEMGKRERLRFQWGSKGIGFDYQVELMRFDCTYTRFARNGRPIRAEIRNLTLHVLDHTDGPTHLGGTSPALTATAPAAGVPAGLPAGTGPDRNADGIRVLLKNGGGR